MLRPESISSAKTGDIFDILKYTYPRLDGYNLIVTISDTKIHVLLDNI